MKNKEKKICQRTWNRFIKWSRLFLAIFSRYKSSHYDSVSSTISLPIYLNSFSKSFHHTLDTHAISKNLFYMSNRKRHYFTHILMDVCMWFNWECIFRQIHYKTSIISPLLSNVQRCYVDILVEKKNEEKKDEKKQTNFFDTFIYGLLLLLGSKMTIYMIYILWENLQKQKLKWKKKQIELRMTDRKEYAINKTE